MKNRLWRAAKKGSEGMGIAVSSTIGSPRRRMVSSVIMIGVLVFQALIFLNLPRAFASAPVWSPDALTILAGETQTTQTSVNGYGNLSVSFHYDISKLESSDSDTLEYGWRNGMAGVDHQLGSLLGQTGSPGPNEVGDITVALPDIAGVSELVLYFTNTGTTDGAYDRVTVSALTVSGAVVADIVDATAPEAPVITTPLSRQWFKSEPILNQWSAVSDESGIDYYQIAYNYDDGHSFGGSTCPGVSIAGVTGFIGCRDVDGTQRNHTPSPSEQGGVTIWVRAVDNAGNIGPWSDSVHYNFDSILPTVTISAPEGLTDGTFSISGQASDNLELNRVYVQLVSRDDGKRYGGITINLIGQGQSADWSREYTVGTDGLSGGTYAAHVSVVDMAGNTASAGWTDDFVVDDTDPVVSITAPSDTDVVNGTVIISGAVVDENPGHYYLVIKDASGKAVGGPGTVHSWDVDDYEWDTTAAPDGEYTIFLAARDAAGNKDGDATTAGVSVQSIDVAVDNTAPVVTFTLPAKGTIYAPGDVKVYGTVDTSAVGTVTVTLNSVAQDVTFDQDGNWTVIFTNLVAGQYDLSATASDAVGNIGEADVANVIVNAVGISIIVPQPQPEQRPVNENARSVTAQTPAANLTPFAFTANNLQAGNSPIQTPTSAQDEAEVLAEETVAVAVSDVKAAEVADPAVLLEEGSKQRDFSGMAYFWWLLAITTILGAVIFTIVRWRRLR